MTAPLLTIFTPAYNRAHTLPRLYQSLCNQTSHNFIWLVVDDGSTDDTEALVMQWKKETTLFEIIYIKQENQGMHGAHNTAYKNITTVLNTCIDSDDYAPLHTVATIEQVWEGMNQEKYAGIIGLDNDTKGNIIGTSFTTATTTLEDFYLHGGKGDKKLVYRTAVINSYPEYPLFEGERYVGLGYKYLLVDQDYEMVTINQPLVTVEYQQDGSSLNMFKQYRRHPKGFAFIRKTAMVLSKSPKRRFVEAVHYVSASIFSKNWNFISESPKKLLTILAIPAGILLNIYIRIKSSREFA
jgi:glycosyltransferase involved in cell wall biosynthesis